jgi:HD-like signal output (HDOD) protein
MSQAGVGRKRILFVDDEPAILELYRLMFKAMNQEWDLSFARSGTEALAVMEKLPVEVVVTDMRMSGMNGAQLLNEVMQRYPKTVRLILSGYAEQEAVAKCVGAAHQYLMKPCDFPTLKSTLVRVCALDVFLRNDTLKQLVARMGALPSLPSLYFRILQELQSPNSSTERIGEIVAMDPAMTAKILQLVNSAFFGVRRKISNTAEAVQLLGVGTVRSLAISIHAFSCFDQAKLKQFPFEALWNHSLIVGVCAKKITQMHGDDAVMGDEAFIAGLLHDIGKLMMAANLSDQYRAASDLVTQKQIPAWQAEQQVFGADHSEVGAYLLGLWGLPVPIVEAVALHHCPAKNVNGAFCPLTAVHVANALHHEVSGLTATEPRSLIDLGYLAGLGLKDSLESWRQRFAEMARQANGGA